MDGSTICDPAAVSPASDTGVAKASTAFLSEWLVNRNDASAAAYFAPRAAFCSDVKDAGSVPAFLASIGDQLPRGASLADLVTSVPFGHPHLREVAHPQAGAFLLTEVSTDLAKTLECNAAAPDRASTMGQPKFDGQAYRTDFAIRSAKGEAGAVSLLWRRERNNWRVVAATIVAH